MTIQGIDLKSLKQCAWCRQWEDSTGPVVAPKIEPAAVSHGICRDCLAIELEKLRASQDSIRLMEGFAA